MAARDLRAGLLNGTVDGIQEAVAAVNAPATAPLPTAKGPIDLSIESGDACPRYLGLLIEGVRVGPSPDAIQQRLRAIGVNPQTTLWMPPITSCTNWASHCTPLTRTPSRAMPSVGTHVMAKIDNLDGEERTLHADDQVIADATKPMLGRCVRRDTSGVSESTTRVFLESAYFNPAVTRKMAKRHGLSPMSFRSSGASIPR